MDDRNGDALNQAGSGGSTSANRVLGWMDWTLSSDNSNWATIIGPELLLSPYTANRPGVCLCPADRYLSSQQRRAGGTRRVRRLSMNQCLGNQRDNLGFHSVLKLDQLTQTVAARTWVFVDEHPDSINNGFFTVYASQDAWGGSAHLPPQRRL